MRLKQFSKLLLSACFILVISCTKDSLDPTLYSYSSAATEIKWTAYKYTDKIGVSGIFKEYTISGLEYQAPIQEMLSDVTIDIKTESLNTQSTFRDQNILDYYFRKLNNHEIIQASVIKVTGNESKGKVYVMMDFNNISNEIAFDFIVKGGNLFLEADIELIDWNATQQLDNFEECCADLHTGEDGLQVLWPTIHLEIRTGIEISS